VSGWNMSDARSWGRALHAMVRNAGDAAPPAETTLGRAKGSSPFS
jgi:hypothetical protein